MNLRYKPLRIFYEGDGGANGGGTTPPPANTEPPAQTTPPAKEDNFDVGNVNAPKDEVKFRSQLSKDNQSLDFGEIKTIDDLTKGYFDRGKQLENAIQFPTQNSSEEDIKSFLSKIGVPDGADKYNIEQGKMSDEQFKSLENIFRTEAYGAALSSTQATKMWNMVQTHFSAQENMVNNALEQAQTSFPTRFDSYLKNAENIADPNVRETSMKENATLFNKFAKDTGLDSLFSTLGLNLNPEFITKMAKVAKAAGDSTFVKSSSNTRNTNKNSFGYGSQWDKAYGGK